MGKIAITFQEEGQDSVSFEIPAQIAAKLDQYVADVNSSAVLGAAPFTGKADLFARHNIETLLTPIVQRYPDPDPPEVLDLEQQKAQLNAQIAAARARTLIVPVTPEG